LRDFLSINIKARRKVLGISQEKLAELADISIQMIKMIEGRRSWVGEEMLAKLAHALGVSAFQLLIPANEDSGDSPVIEGLLLNLRQNLHDDINVLFDRLLSPRRGPC
jgi:transcriptional regulator with XRE-family HTH domain